MSVKDFLKSKIAAICMQLAAVCFIGMFLLGRVSAQRLAAFLR